MAPVEWLSKWKYADKRIHTNKRIHTDDCGLSPLPKKRGDNALWASNMVVVFATIGVSVIVTMTINEDVYVKNEAANHTTTNTFNDTDCYKRQKKISSTVCFTIALGVLSAVLRNLLHRCTLAFEECRHVQSRYGGNWIKMSKACFSGVDFGEVVDIIIFVVILCLFSIVYIDIKLKLTYINVILTSIGFGPLVLRLLKLDTQSDVQISSIIENQEKSVGSGLAWYYYFSYLKDVLPLVKQGIKKSVYKDTIYPKLLILIPSDCDTTSKNIENLHNQFHKTDAVIECSSRHFDVYRVDCRQTKTSRYFVMEYATTPLQVLMNMSKYKSVPSVPIDKRTEELKMFYRTLKEILTEPRLVHSICKDTYELIPFDSSEPDRLLIELLKRRIPNFQTQQQQQDITINRNDHDSDDYPAHRANGDTYVQTYSHV